MLARLETCEEEEGLGTGTDGGGPDGGVGILGSIPSLRRRFEAFKAESLSIAPEVNDETEEDIDARRGRCSGVPKAPGAVPNESTGD